MRKRQITYLHIGSNQGDRITMLGKAKAVIETEIGDISKASSFYETEAWGNEDQPDFINQAFEVRTSLSPEELMATVLEVEEKLGRIRTQKWSARTIDIDILFYEQQCIQTPNLTVPHPLLHQRNFVLIPMMEIAPDFIHPKLAQSIEELYLISEDTLEVHLLSEESF